MNEHVGELKKLSETGLTLSDPNEDIRGREVVDLNGDKIGRVDELMVDPQARKVRFLQVGSGGFLGLGREHVLVPVDAITAVTDDSVRIGHTRDQVAGSPAYAPDLETGRSYYAGVYDYYGFSPFWDARYQYPPYPYYGSAGAVLDEPANRTRRSGQ